MASLQMRPASSLKAAPAVRAGFSRQTRVAVNAVFTKNKAKTASYVCLDCGYLYTDATPFEELKSYACPVCNAPKRRFKELRGNTMRANDAKSLQARKQKLRDQIEADGGNPDEGQNEFLIATSVGIVATLVGLYFLSQ